ncbi:MAG: FecR domain-containing protein [Prolixibacteraceae bacterium]|nr:FecR domain-containing protein [Prolixibacteraceae bacterium]
MQNVSKYLEDARFIEWIFSTDNILNEWWKSFETANPEEKQNINEARMILQQLTTVDKDLSQNDKILLFTRILKEVELRENGSKSNRFFVNFLKYAAIAVIFFLLGAVLFHHRDNFNPLFYTQEIFEPVNSDEARLIRPDGASIILDEKKSFIEHREDGNVVVNNGIIESDKSVIKDSPKLNQLVIPYGKTSEVTLSDGTRIFLNAGSRLVYPEFFTGKIREVFLVGEAFFEVEYDENNPFVVRTTDLKIRVLGTSFNVSAYPSDKIIETVLAKGKVRLEQESSGLFSETTEMVPGQLAAFSKTERTTKIKSVDTDNFILWKDGMYKFESTDLSRVIKKLERYYNIRFVYKDPLLGSIKISGKLGLSENREDILDNLASAASVRIEKKGENYYEIGQ